MLGTWHSLSLFFFIKNHHRVSWLNDSQVITQNTLNQTSRLCSQDLPALKSRRQLDSMLVYPTSWHMQLLAGFCCLSPSLVQVLRSPWAPRNFPQCLTISENLWHLCFWLLHSDLKALLFWLKSFLFKDTYVMSHRMQSIIQGIGRPLNVP